MSRSPRPDRSWDSSDAYEVLHLRRELAAAQGALTAKDRLIHELTTQLVRKDFNFRAAMEYVALLEAQVVDVEDDDAEAPGAEVAA